ncbi:MAG: glycosyltransferase family 4 protein [Methanomassiliicoccales archaeon]|jgi:glycosyltransferase involved in cell wall biosynthesis|nr:glycosyltransferase family 4 protein [Methanomassiliicoccales archaeon]
MKIGLVNLITKSSDVLSDPSLLFKANNLRPATDSGIQILEMGKRIASRGHEVDIFVADAFRPLEQVVFDENLRVHYLPTRLQSAIPAPFMPFTPSLATQIAREHYDVVQASDLFQIGTVLSWLGAKSIEARHFVWQEIDVFMRQPAGMVQSLFYKFSKRAMIDGISGLIPRSLSAKSHLIACGFPQDKLREIVHSGVDTTNFRPMDKYQCRKRLGIEDADFVLLSVSRLDWIKGIDKLIVAMVNVVRELPNSILIIQGVGPEEGKLRELIDSLNLKKNIRLITQPFRHNTMPLLYNVADLLLITSRIDLFPFVAIESISCGVPIASSFGRGIKTDIIDKGAGVMLSGDSARMGEELVTLVTDSNRIRKMASIGRNLAEREFDFEVSADRFLKIYKEA